MVQRLAINFERLKQHINELATIGRGEDLGIYRMAFSDADMQARRWLLERIEAAGLAGEMDAAANVIGRVNTDRDAPAVLMGSHTDTVPAGGHLDGALGVLVALECLQRIREEGIQTRHPVEMLAFSDEEGRFGGLLGSAALCGELTPDRIHGAADLNGLRLEDAMSRHGLDAMEVLRVRRKASDVHAYLELHIEQGPVLDRKGLHAGVVTEITGLFKWTIRLIGGPDHAGTTPMDMRKDAFLGLAEFSGEIPRILEEHGTEHSRATIGRVDLFPGSANTVPGRVDFSLDVRDTQKATLEELADAFRRALSAIARRRGLMFEFDVLSQVDPVCCDPELISIIDKAAEDAGVEVCHMPSGAVHDAQIMARLTRIGMIFVPSKDGRSHSTAEWTHWEDIDIGANLAFHTLLRMAGAEGV